MGKTALIAIAAFALMGAIYGLSASRGMVGTTETIAAHQYEIMARNAAVTGFEEAKHRLSESFVGQSIFGEYEEAFYLVSVSVAGNLATVTSIGTAIPPEGGKKDFNIVAKLELDTSFPTSDVPPPFMQYALLSDEDLNMGGDLLVDTVTVEGSEATVLNANVHTNGKLAVAGGKAKIRGFGTYKTVENVTHKDVFQPNNNPEQDEAVQQVDNAIEIPSDEFDVATIATEVEMTLGGVDSTTSGVTLSGTYDFTSMGATRDDPFVWRVNGDLSTTGNTVLKGYVMFLVDGNVTLSGNLQQNVGAGPSESQAAFYASGDVNVSGTADVIWAQIFAKNNVTLSGSSTLYGNVTAGNEVQVNGTPTIKYYPASPALTKIWQDPLTRLKLLSYREF